MAARTRRAERIVRAARCLVGTPFRLHGRDPRSGVDCIGLVALAMAGAGCMPTSPPPRSYTMRGGSVERLRAGLAAAGFRPVRYVRDGDVLLVQAGVAQFHIMIAVPGGHVHADAGLGRVVEMPGASPWPVIGRWRWRKARNN